MLSLFEAMSGPVIRSWHMRLPDPSRGRREEVHKVQLRHFPLTGHRSVTVDGIIVQGVESEEGVGTLQVRVGSHDCWVGYRAASRLSRSYYYSCIVDGVVMPELNETVGDSGDGDGEAIPLPGDVCIDGVGTAKDSAGAEFLEFRVVTRRGLKRRRSSTGGGGGGSGRGHGHGHDHGFGFGRGGTREDGEAGSSDRRNSSGGGGAHEAYHYAIVWRRFSAFRSLHSDVTSMLWGSHLLNSLPPLPAKCINPLVNQTGNAFVERRRAVLQAYLRRMLEVPKARASVNLMGFLGLHPITGSPLPWAASSLSEPRHG
ncbi:unnamed protein product [Pylaiella littoralis]